MTDHELEPWELPGAPGENRTKADYEKKIAALKEPRWPTCLRNGVTECPGCDTDACCLNQEDF